MKKIFYILASAIVALGAVACENEGMENIAPEVNGDTVSFVANIDNTKTDLDGLQTVWTAGDEITVVWNEKEYTFTNSDKNVNEFSCTAEGLSAIVGQPVVAWYNKNGVDSSAGTAGAQLKAEGSFGELSFQIQSAFLKFTTTEEVVLAGEGLFNNAKATYTGTNVYVAINAVESTLSYSVNGIECKSLTKNFEAGKIYKLGTLVAPNVFIVENNASWAKVNLYAWSGDTKICGEWPGTTMTQIGSTNRYYVEIPAEYVGQSFNYIVNNGDNQTRDLEVDNFEACYTKAIGDPDPNNITIYLNNNWSVSDLKMHTWDPTLWEGQTWENRKAPDGTVTTDWGTFSYWNVDANQIKSDNVGNLLITGTDKQTADLYDVNYSKDVYLQFVWKDNKDSLQILTTPY